MQRRRRALAATRAMTVVTVLALQGGVALATQSREHIPLVNLDNPCTDGPDNINGRLDWQGELDRQADGSLVLNWSAQGSGSDTENRAYRLTGGDRFEFPGAQPTDLLATVRLRDAGESDARLVLAIHVDERGHFMTVGASGSHCRTRVY